MLNLFGPEPSREGLNRREMLRVGGLGLTGLALPALMPRLSASQPAGAKKAAGFGKAKNCIILYLSGGPAQLDTFDPKPDAPEDIRGEFGTIQTSLPGLRYS